MHALVTECSQVQGKLTFPIFRFGNWSFGRLSGLLRVTQLTCNHCSRHLGSCLYFLWPLLPVSAPVPSAGGTALSSSHLKPFWGVVLQRLEPLDLEVPGSNHPTLEYPTANNQPGERYRCPATLFYVVLVLWCSLFSRALCRVRLWLEWPKPLLLNFFFPALPSFPPSHTGSPAITPLINVFYTNHLSGSASREPDLTATMLRLLPVRVLFCWKNPSHRSSYPLALLWDLGQVPPSQGLMCLFCKMRGLDWMDGPLKSWKPIIPLSKNPFVCRELYGCAPKKDILLGSLLLVGRPSESVNLLLPSPSLHPDHRGSGRDRRPLEACVCDLMGWSVHFNLKCL